MCLTKTYLFPLLIATLSPASRDRIDLCQCDRVAQLVRSVLVDEERTLCNLQQMICDLLFCMHTCTTVAIKTSEILACRDYVLLSMRGPTAYRFSIARPCTLCFSTCVTLLTLISIPFLSQHRDHYQKLL